MKNTYKLSLQRPVILFILAVLWIIIYSSCTNGNANIGIQTSLTTPTSIAPEPTPPVSTPAVSPVADAATILGRQEVPILCYHQIRDYKVSDSKTARDYIVPVSSFEQQVKALADSGYHTILPNQLQEYLTTGKALPSKPVMLTFDDTRVDQYTVALPTLTKYGFKGVFFIMTVSLGRPGYMDKAQVKSLSDLGHTIGSHTWDHKNVKKYTEEDWNIQIVKPSKQLQSITGKSVDYFAYPFGLWNKEAIAGLRKHSEFKAVYQLSAKRDDKDPLYSIRRIIVPGQWSGPSLMRSMRNSF